MMENLQLTLELLPCELSVCRVSSLKDIDLGKSFFFLSRTDEEISLVCRTEDCPEHTVRRDDGWRGFRIQGVLAFSMVGVLARLAAILAENQISIFAVSTYNTDYFLVKREDYDRSVSVLQESGYTILWGKSVPHAMSSTDCLHHFE